MADEADRIAFDPPGDIGARQWFAVDVDNAPTVVGDDACGAVERQPGEVVGGVVDRAVPRWPVPSSSVRSVRRSTTWPSSPSTSTGDSQK
jgi:hypothetical protein